MSRRLCFKKLNLALGFLRVITNKNSINADAAMKKNIELFFSL